MSTKIIVSYDGTANEDDAVALGRVFARAGAEVALAYVRHSQEPDRDRETLAQNEAEELLERGAGLFGIPDVARHVVTDRSTPEGLRALAEREGAERGRVLLGLAHRQRPHGRRQLRPAACSRAARWPSRSRRSAWPDGRM